MSSIPARTSLSHGKRTLPQTLDYLASHTPNRLYASITRDRDLSSGFMDVSCADVAKCANFMAYWIENNLGSSTEFETLTYVGIPDLRSAAVFLGAVKSGYKVSSQMFLTVISHSQHSEGSASLSKKSAGNQPFSDAADPLHEDTIRIRGQASRSNAAGLSGGPNLLRDTFLPGNA
jgi:hypothetical protein